MKVYLAGPITGLTYDGATDWRKAVAKRLETMGFTAMDPMRGKSYLKHLKVLDDATSDSSTPLSTPAGIVTRDRNDVREADVIIFNLLGAKRVSIGTMVEIGWADAYRKMAVVVMEEEGNPHDHAFVNQLTGFRVASVDEAVAVVKSLSPYTL